MKVPSKGWNAYTYSVVGLITAITVFSFPETTSKIAANEIVASPTTLTIKATTTIPVLPSLPENPFDALTIEGKAGYVYDITAGKTLYTKNENDQMPLASINKIMTAITALELSTTSTSTVIVSSEALSTEGDTGLLAGEEWDLRDLLIYTLIVSSNDGAAVAAESFNADTKYFVNEMNRRGQAIGLSRGWFHNSSGLDESSEIAGGYGSARDVYKLMKYALDKHGNIMNATNKATISITSLDGFVHTGKNTNILTSKVPNLLLSKTGYSGLAGGNLAIVFQTENNHTIAVVVLGSSYDGRFVDVDKLVEASIKAQAN
ncbi:MAG: serine hydrolase [bacterium]|nr:serine hydrolase [bacterium]